MQKNKYKLSKLAQAHLRKIKSYTINNFSEMQWNNYKDTLLTKLIGTKLIGTDTLTLLGRN